MPLLAWVWPMEGVYHLARTPDLGSTSLGTLCERLVQLEFPVTRSLTRGLHQEEMATLLQNLPLKPPQEVLLYYQWRNGLPEDVAGLYPLFPSGYLLTLEQAIDLYTTLVQQAAIFATETGFTASSFWDEHWLPIFSDGSLRYHVVLCSETQQATSPIFSIESESPGSLYWAYDSLSSLLMTVVIAYEVGAYSLEDDGVYIRQDRAKLQEIINRYNPQQRAVLLADVGKAATLEDLVSNLAHPDPAVANKALLALMLLGDSSVVESLSQLLQHPTPMVRNLAVRALGEIGDRRAVDALLWVSTNDPLNAIQQSAESALHQIRSRAMGQG